jgi:hypothetical protein
MTSRVLFNFKLKCLAIFFHPLDIFILDNYIYTIHESRNAKQWCV